MAYQITPIKTDMSYRGDIPCNTDKMYENVMTKFQWGGLDKAEPGSLYLDETVRRMVTTTRTTLVSLAETLIEEGQTAQAGLEAGNANFLGKDAKSYADDRFTKAMMSRPSRRPSNCWRRRFFDTATTAASTSRSAPATMHASPMPTDSSTKDTCHPCLPTTLTSSTKTRLRNWPRRSKHVV